MIKVIFLFFFLLWGPARASADTISVADKGKQLYLSYGCALCHGRNGEGDGISSQRFSPPPTNFHNPKAYLHGHDRDSIRRSIQYGIKEDNSIMPAFEDIPPEEINQIISYLQSLQNDKHNKEKNQ
jgi:mono/diheme cytochrome c family protein